MKQFLYLDTDIVNSIIAQAEKGLVVQHSSQSSLEEMKNEGKDESVSGKADFGGGFMKMVQTQAELKIDNSFSRAESNTLFSNDVFEKILHDAAFDIAYEYINIKNTDHNCQDSYSMGDYLELKRVYSFIDLKYFEKLFSKEGIKEYVKKLAAEKIEAETKEKVDEYNREVQRKAEKSIKKEVQQAISISNKYYDDIETTIKMFRTVVPYDRLLVSSDGYIIPLDEKYFRVDPTNLGFRYGGAITCVGMVTNIISAESIQNKSDNIFVTLQYTVNNVLRAILPSTDTNLCVIHPIAVYYGD